MPTRADAFADSILATKPLFTRFLTGFDERSRTAQLPGMPNHVIWTLGHLAMTMHKVAEKFDGLPLPESDFSAGDGAQRGDAERFDLASIVIGSHPIDEASRYPTLARGRAIFERACDRFADAVRSAGDAKLDEPIIWHDGELPLWSLVARVCFHNGTHAGQLTDLRRMLGMPPIIAARS